MSNIAVVTDSASDLEQGQIEGLTVVPLHLHFGDELFEDGLTLTKPDFWNRHGRRDRRRRRPADHLAACARGLPGGLPGA